jgi:hypothetical protein
VPSRSIFITPWNPGIAFSACKGARINLVTRMHARGFGALPTSKPPLGASFFAAWACFSEGGTEVAFM